MDGLLELAGRLRLDLDALGCRRVLVLGAADSGKTSLVEALARTECRAGKPVCVIDSDVGQSHIGPPTTVAWPRSALAIASSLVKKRMSWASCWRRCGFR